MSENALLAYMNEIVDSMNAKLMDRLPGEYLIAHSLDRPINPSRTNDLDVHQADTNLEFFHSKTPSGMPPHELKLKVGTPVLMTTNLDVESGLVNGTRMQLLDMTERRTENGPTLPMARCRVLNGKSKGRQVLIVPTRFFHALKGDRGRHHSSEFSSRSSQPSQ